MSSKRLLHLGPVALFVAATIAWLWPVLHAPGEWIPGQGAGDNITFVWNVWWLRTALRAHGPVFFCSYLFAPLGVDLTLHTLAALPSGIAALVSRGGSVVAATNGIIAVDLFLNFAAAYWLAIRLTGSVWAGALGGLAFGWCPYVAAHLQGHFNLVAAWPLPVAAALLFDTVDATTTIAPLLLGVTCGLVPYVDYYDSVYVGTLIVVLLAACLIEAERARPLRDISRWQRLSMTACTAALVLDCVVGFAIWLTGGGAIVILGTAVSLRGTANTITIAWLLLAAIAALVLLPGLRLRWDRARVRRVRRRLAVAGAVALVLVAPLAIHAAHLIASGGYVTQRYLWRSAPAGVDVATLMFGNPYGLLTSAGRSAYSHVRIDLIEQVAWIGPALLILSGASALLTRARRFVRAWSCAAIVFFVWALGPYLRVAGHRTPLMLPETLLRFVPVVANARIPGRAMVVVYLAAAMLGAMGLRALSDRGHRAVAALFVAMLVVDYLPAPVAAFALDHPAIYDVLRSQPAGAVIELPLGLRDGFGEVGRFDSRVLWYQTIHEHPIAGGFVARLTPHVVDEYRHMPVVNSLLDCSSGAFVYPSVSPSEAAALLRRSGFRYIVTEDAAMPIGLRDYVHSLALQPIATGGGRTLYKIQ